jgi:hypothetical protein
VFLHARLVALGGRGVSVRRLGKTRAGEIRITRFLRNKAVSIEEMVARAAARTGERVAGRHGLAIQDTTTVGAQAQGRAIALHPVIAVDAVEGTLLGLQGACFFGRDGGRRGERKDTGFADQESRRWLEGAERAAGLAASGAACVTVVADREGDGKSRRQDGAAENPHPRGSLAYAAWTLARLGGWTGSYGKPGPIVMLAGLVQFHAIKHGWTLRHV